MFALAVLAATSAWLVARKAPQHRPLAWALTVCTGLDAVRLLGLPARVDMALCLGAPLISAWAYLVTFTRRPLMSDTTPVSWVMWSAFIMTAPNPERWWSLPLALSYGAAIGGGLLAAHHFEGPWTISQRAALILLAGDALAVASLCAREWISNQAGVVLAAVTLYQMTWWWRWRRVENDS